MSTVAQESSQVDCDATLTNNLQAIESIDPQTATLVREAAPPDRVSSTLGRDGSPTYTWTDDTGRTQWLGRTTMPTVSIPAVLESFQPGLGNIFLHPFGHGLEARSLLDQMLRHQAIFVVDADASAVRLALSLTNLHDGLTTGRLHFFTGEQAWEDFESFLIANPGYLTPERVLARPWFSRTDISELSNRLSAIATRVNQFRAALKPPEPRSHDLLILSNVATPHVFETAANIRDAAVSLGWTCDLLIPDAPQRVEARFVQRCIDACTPRTTLLMDTTPGRLPFRLPQGPHVVFLSDSAVPDVQPNSDMYLCVDSTRRVDAFRRSGWSSERIFLVPAAASPQLAMHDPRPGRQIAFIGDRPDPSPEAAGLNMLSHQHLWRAVTELLRGSTNLNDAAAILGRAEKKLGIRIESDHVRSGLIQRIETHLLPFAAFETCTAALTRQGIEFHSLGKGWKHIEGVAPDDIGLAIFAYPHADSVSRALNFLASGIAVAAIYDFNWPQGFDTNLTFTFKTPDELAQIAEAFAADPSSALERAARARTHILAQHTWLTRLRELATALRLSTRAAF